MTTQVTLTIPELSALVHALDVRLLEFQGFLKNERTLVGTPFGNEKLIAYYEEEIAEAKELLGKLEFANLQFNY